MLKCAWTTKSLSIRLIFGVAAHINKFKNVILCLIDLSTTLFWAFFFNFVHIPLLVDKTDIAICFTKIKVHLLLWCFSTVYNVVGKFFNKYLDMFYRYHIKMSNAYTLYIKHSNLNCLSISMKYLKLQRLWPTTHFYDTF